MLLICAAIFHPVVLPKHLLARWIIYLGHKMKIRRLRGKRTNLVSAGLQNLHNFPWTLFMEKLINWWHEGPEFKVPLRILQNLYPLFSLSWKHPCFSLPKISFFLPINLLRGNLLWIIASSIDGNFLVCSKACNLSTDEKINRKLSVLCKLKKIQNMAVRFCSFLNRKMEWHLRWYWKCPY